MCLALLGLSWGMWDLAPWPGIEPGSPPLGAQSLSHLVWATGAKEVPVVHFLIGLFGALLLLLWELFIYSGYYPATCKHFLAFCRLPSSHSLSGLISKPRVSSFLLALLPLAALPTLCLVLCACACRDRGEGTLPRVTPPVSLNSADCWPVLPDASVASPALAVGAVSALSLSACLRPRPSVRLLWRVRTVGSHFFTL